MRALRTRRLFCAVALSAVVLAIGCGDDNDDVNTNAENYDGTEAEAGPGDVVSIPPGHDAEIVGDETCVFIDFSGFEDYAK